jgi:hypothetical protein
VCCLALPASGGSGLHTLSSSSPSCSPLPFSCGRGFFLASAAAAVEEEAGGWALRG